jgi:hypothetical protein
VQANVQIHIVHHQYQTQQNQAYLQLSLFYPPGGVAPMSEFMSVLPLPDDDVSRTQRFILIWAKEGPTSSRGEFVLSCTEAFV